MVDVNVYEISALIAAVPTGLAILLQTVKLGKELVRPSSVNGAGTKEILARIDQLAGELRRAREDRDELLLLQIEKLLRESRP